MYIDDNVFLKLAGLQDYDLHSDTGKELDAGQRAFLAAFYLGRKLEDVESRLRELNETLKGFSVDNIATAIEELTKAWRQT